MDARHIVTPALAAYSCSPCRSPLPGWRPSRHIVDALDLPGANVIFTDAALPAGSGPSAVTDSGFLPFLCSISKDGVLPPWPHWRPREDLSPLYPPQSSRAT